MSIAPLGLRDPCASRDEYRLNHSNFVYAETMKNLTFVYGCPMIQYMIRYKFTCGFSFYNYYADEAILELEKKKLQHCKENVTVPVSEKALSQLLLGDISLQEALNQDLDVEYFANRGGCAHCENTLHGLCGSNLTTHEFLCLTVDDDTNARPLGSLSDQKESELKKILIGIGFAAAVLLCLGIISITLPYWSMRTMKSSNLEAPFCKMRQGNDKNIEMLIRKYEDATPKRFKCSDIKKITNSFGLRLGEGGYGRVYKGKLPDGRLVAVKMLKQSKGIGEEFMNEVFCISQTCHVNIVSLLGFSFQGDKRALVYEFMANGSLDNFIYDGKGSKAYLGWKILKQIAIGVARGLEYLHRGCNTRILHLDIKPQNILLNEDFFPKIADFGLSKLCSRKQSIVSMEIARGTIGYIAPEMYSRTFGNVSHKSDVYSYGMMMLEMVSGKKKKNVKEDHTSKYIFFPHWIYRRLELGNDLGLHSVVTKEDDEIARNLVVAGLWCMQTNPSQRPSIREVLLMLEVSAEALTTPPQPFHFFPQNSDGEPSSSPSVL